MGPVQTSDSHEKNFERLRDELLPQLDQTLSAMIDDLAATSLLDETMVVMTGEFGRTPEISTLLGSQFAGRNHWAPVYTALFAGV
jgi:membrane-anchored protein YejM (alkaline phosphatase superfamily)